MPGPDVTLRMRLPARFRALIPVMLLTLSGCATYHRAPLGDPSQALAQTENAALANLTVAIDRPYLSSKPVDLSAPLDRDSVALVALAQNPDLRALRDRLAVSKAQLFDAGLLPDPSVNLNADKVISGPVSAVAGTIGGQILQDINALRTRSVRREAARENFRQVRLDLAWAEWQVVEGARLQATKVYYLQQQAGLAAQNREAAQDLLDRNMRAAGRGDVSSAQVDSARIGLVDAVDKANGLALALTQAQADLRRTTGLAPSADLKIATPELPKSVPSLQKLSDFAVQNRFDLEALRAGYASQEAVVRKAIMDQFPTLNLGISFSRDNSNNGFLGGLVDFTLPLFNRNRGQIAIARATRTALHAEYDARLFQTRADLDAALSGMQELRKQQQRLSSELPALERYASSAAAAAKRGDLAPATAIAAAQTVRDRQLLLLGAQQLLAEQAIAAEMASLYPWELWP